MGTGRSRTRGEFDEFTLFWLGETYQGLPLTDTVYAESEKVVLFVYGTCDPGHEEGCAPPLSLRVEPCVQSPPGSSVQGDRRVWTRDVTITISAVQVPAEQVRKALRPVSRGSEDAVAPLDSPIEDCQQ